MPSTAARHLAPSSALRTTSLLYILLCRLSSSISWSRSPCARLYTCARRSPCPGRSSTQAPRKAAPAGTMGARLMALATAISVTASRSSSGLATGSSFITTGVAEPRLGRESQPARMSPKLLLLTLIWREGGRAGNGEN